MSVSPELVARFRADLAEVWPLCGFEEVRLGLAVSGGGDSLALLLLAHAALPGRVAAATIDHRLRDGSAAEAELVAGYCADLGVPHRTIPVVVGKGNLQDRARAARYEALGNWCEQENLEGLATAHQLDDQAETVLMRLNRGSGLAGLAGIRALARLPDAPIRLVRPLLGWRRAELAAIVRLAGWEAASDPTNEDPTFNRIRIRRGLANAAWLDPAGIATSARHLAEADLTLEWIIGREYVECVVVREDEAIYHALRTGIVGSLIHGGVIQSIYRGFGAEIDRAAAAGLVASLRAGRKANVGGVQAEIRDAAGERQWVFRPENPRRTG